MGKIQGRVRSKRTGRGRGRSIYRWVSKIETDIDAETKQKIRRQNLRAVLWRRYRDRDRGIGRGRIKGRLGNRGKGCNIKKGLKERKRQKQRQN